MKRLFHRYRIRIFMAVFLFLCCYGFYLSFKSNETKNIVQEGVAAQQATIHTLVVQKQQAKQEAKAAKQQAKQVKKQVADSTAVVIQKKQEVIDSLIKKKPNEVLVSDPDNPTAIAGSLTNYKPDTIRLENSAPIY